ncbi:hypothetical protein JCM9140_4349 [Halalkalibacter wakoensis JCM 9140]|uniref:Uncharacterized protein n=2 Tax=Halalkalibacter TaxID=2893056 RepID=W4QIW4_9BACI|nr:MULTISPECIES: hypothetical protein [Halalkalibacter]GAE28144.1 hypothetical protein JCM9140_4349 [Halalkalibacter wakoensis JCM 9140]GAE32021.1 hypothetical protein JCM9152_3535 [Halalkalibacter hemicellulosilyticusJCM 9152]
MDRLFIISLLLLTIILITNPSTTHAHRLVIEPLEPGEIRVVYDDSRFSTRTTVTVYVVNGIVLQTGGLDDQAIFIKTRITLIFL